jgi:NAD-dependent SIR2 family protein deacetylase
LALSNLEETPEIAADDFARRFSMRSWNLMWLLGAGASGAAGIPTAGDMIWEFKQKLFVSQRHASPEMVADLSAPAVRQHLQAHIDSLSNLPPAGAPDEYSALFETVFPSEADRRTYLDSKMAGAKPSYGHLAIATLMRADRARLVWTTNFDPLVTDSCAKVFEGTGALTTVALDAPAIARQAINEERWPIEIKLHGDFKSRRLKNTGDELRHQDEQLRAVFVEACGRMGLVVAGYSGRDESIMRTLEAALEKSGAFPAGLFWLHRGDDAPYERVADLLRNASAQGIEAGLVRVQNFDEALRDLIRLIPDLNMNVLNEFGKQRARWSAAPAPTSKGGWPVIRLNALCFDQIPTVCRRIVCEVGGHADAQKAVQDADVDLVVTRTLRGVLAFGSDEAARAAFSPYNITEFDLAQIEVRRLRYESADRGLLREAFGRAVARQRMMNLVRRRSMDLLYPRDPAAAEFRELAKLVDTLSGPLDEFPELKWFEGVGVRLEWADEKLWVLVEPTMVFPFMTEDAKGAAADLGRERSFKRYNRPLNNLIDFWARFLFGDGTPLRALNTTDGVDAIFKLIERTGFSRRAVA